MKLLFILVFLNTFMFSQSFSSSENKVTVIELYTSQGCSSCPSADDWLNKLKDHPGLFKTFIPLAFHVTYWDFLGWSDLYGKSAYDKRQKEYSSKIWKKNSVYTPQFIIDSKEYRKWFKNRNFPRLQNTYAGVIKANLNKNNIKISYNNKNMDLNKNVFVNIAVLENNLNVFVKKGENKNKKLEHNFVVQDFFSFKSKIINGKLKIDLDFKIDNIKNKALVVFISDEKGNQIQALGLYL